jgi:hypothetical protein
MKIDHASLQQLKQICAESFGKHLSDTESQEIGQRIIRFLLNSDRTVQQGGPLTHPDEVR